MEGAVIILIAVLILKLGIETAWKSIMILMDADMDTELKTEIEAKLNQIQGVKGVTGVKIRRSGPFKIVNCIIKTIPSLILYKSHELADIAENILLTEYENIESVFIHVEPEKEIVRTVMIPVQDKNGLESRLCQHFGKAPYFIIVKLGNDRIEIDSYLANEFLGKKGHIGLNIAKTVIKYPIHLLFVSSIGEISFHLLKNNYVDIFKVDKQMIVKDIFTLYKANKLDPMTQPNLSKKQF